MDEWIQLKYENMGSEREQHILGGGKGVRKGIETADVSEEKLCFASFSSAWDETFLAHSSLNLEPHYLMELRARGPEAW